MWVGFGLVTVDDKTINIGNSQNISHGGC